GLLLLRLLLHRDVHRRWRRRWCVVLFERVGQSVVVARERAPSRGCLRVLGLLGEPPAPRRFAAVISRADHCDRQIPRRGLVPSIASSVRKRTIVNRRVAAEKEAAAGVRRLQSTETDIWPEGE